MSRQLQVSRELALPLDAVTRTFGIVGQRGKGKTTAAVDLVEEIAKAGGRALVVDPTGVWWGLAHPGAGPGLGAIVLGGEHGDVPLEETGGRVVAELVTTADYQVVVLDLKLLRKQQQVRFAADFFEALYHQNREPLHVVIDEADRFIPQNPREAGHLPRAMGAVEDIVKLGRSRGLGASLVTQRPATLNKNVLEQVETLVVFGLMGPRDRKAIHDWVTAQGDPEREHEVLSTLAKLPRGEAWVWSPAFLDFLGRVRFRRRETFDSSATPEVGAKQSKPRPRTQVDLDALRAAMQATIERAKADDPKQLRARIAGLERDLAAAAKATEPQVRVERVEVPVFDEQQFDALYRRAREIREGLEAMEKAIDGLVDELGRRGVRFNDPAERRKPDAVRQRPTVPLPTPPRAPAAGDSDVHLRAGERRMLGTLVSLYPKRVTRAQLGTLAGFKPSGGTFGTYFGVLKRHALLAEADGLVEATDAGIAFLGADAPAAPRTTGEMLDLWRSKLRAGERKMLDHLVDAYPQAVTRDELADETGFTVTGGTFGTYLGVLRRNGLAADAGDGLVRAAEALFITGAPA